MEVEEDPFQGDCYESVKNWKKRNAVKISLDLLISEHYKKTVSVKRLRKNSNCNDLESDDGV